nr:hypothetical protein [Streptococcus parasanguinis]
MTLIQTLRPTQTLTMIQMSRLIQTLIPIPMLTLIQTPKLTQMSRLIRMLTLTRTLILRLRLTRMLKLIQT